ncbi:MAG: hypothetical protein SXA11_10930 [Cyanobacteriota bacterium]|nr:hypothetical protein [Cyanobacteriota bacterium]
MSDGLGAIKASTKSYKYSGKISEASCLREIAIGAGVSLGYILKRYSDKPVPAGSQ